MKKKTSTKSTKNKSSGGTNSAEKFFEETFHVSGEDMIKKVKELIKEANVRKIIVKDKKGNVMAEFPLALGAVLTVLVPVLAAVGAIAALVAECSITVLREKKKK
jgi:hypothetical protein